tara:strand:- start:12450 stop:12833 length:384 start_codon:yes stop_codon:yes gene_type:complete
MPIYCYKTHDGEGHQIQMTADHMVRRQREDGTITLEDGRTATRDMTAEWGGRSKIGGWPMECNASGVQPEDIPEAQAELAEAGVHCDFNKKTGDPVYTSRAHRKECLRAIGMYDRNAGYGDPEPINK